MRDQRSRSLLRFERHLGATFPMPSCSRGATSIE